MINIGGKGNEDENSEETIPKKSYMSQAMRGKQRRNSEEKRGIKYVKEDGLEEEKKK